MGFDGEYIIENWRFYGAFIMDEWAPTKTLGQDKISDDDTHNHNWFGYQLGVTRTISLGDIISSVKIEYAATSPNLYSHDLERNIPQHHNYNIGYWNGGNSKNWNLYCNTIFSEKVSIYFYYSKNSKGVTGYGIDNNINPDLWTKENFKLGFNYSIIPDRIDMDINYNIILSKILYDSQIKGLEFSLKYNIDY